MVVRTQHMRSAMPEIRAGLTQFFGASQGFCAVSLQWHKGENSVVRFGSVLWA